MNRELGKYGEQQAARYLQKNGYKILSQNFYTRYGELDIICEKKQEIIFVEVKTRKSISCGTPEEAITYWKKEHIKKAALIYLKDNRKPFRGLRFDVITVFINEMGEENLNHIENAF
jgi:putative endonuclease